MVTIRMEGLLEETDDLFRSTEKNVCPADSRTLTAVVKKASSETGGAKGWGLSSQKLMRTRPLKLLRLSCWILYCFFRGDISETS